MEHEIDEGFYSSVLNQGNQDIGVPTSGTPTTSIAGFGNIESAINYIVASGISPLNTTVTGTPTSELAPFLSIEQAFLSQSGTSDGHVVGPATATAGAFMAFDGSTGKIAKNSNITVDAQGRIYVGPSGTVEPNYNFTFDYTNPLENGIFIRASDTVGTTAVHIEDSDGTLQLLELRSEGELGLGTENPAFTVDVQQTAGSGSGSVNVRSQYYKAGRRVDSLVQVDFNVGTNLLSVQNELSINASTEVQLGSDFTVNSNNITISNIGTYRVTWNVVGLLTGTTNNRRRNLTARLNRNSGILIDATRGAGYVRNGSYNPYCQASASYIIQTTSDDETVAIRAEDLSTQSSASITFTCDGGYISIERID